MEAEGYEVQAFVLPACAVNAPHRRDRVWFVAHRIASHPHNNGSHIPENRQGMGEGNDGNEKGKNKAGKLARRSGKNAKLAADTPSEGRKERKQSRLGTDCPQDGAGLHDRPERFGEPRNATHTTSRRRFQGMRQSGSGQPTQNLSDWRRFPTQSPVCSRNDGISARLAGITVSRHRRESIKAFGNAIVPQVAVQIFKAIIEAERRMNP